MLLAASCRWHNRLYVVATSKDYHRTLTFISIVLLARHLNGVRDFDLLYNLVRSRSGLDTHWTLPTLLLESVLVSLVSVLLDCGVSIGA